MRIKRSFSTEAILPFLLALAYASLFSGIEFKVGPIKLRPIEFLSVIALFFIFYESELKLRFSSLKFVCFNWFFAVFLIFYVYRAVLGIPFDKVIFFKEVFQLVEILFFWLCFVLVLVNERRVLIFLKMFFVCLIMVGVLNVLDHWASGMYFNYKSNDEPKMVYGLVVLLAYCFFRSNIKIKYLGVLSIIFIAFMLMSGERKSWISLVVAVLLSEMFFVGEKLTLSNFKNKFSLVVLSGVLGVLIVTFFSKAPLVEKQLTAIDDFATTILAGEAQYYEDGDTVSNRARLYAIDLATRLYMDKPIFGIGTEQFIVIIKDVAENDAYAHGVHNYYLEILVENGNVGAALFVLLLVVAFFYLVFLMRPHNNTSISYQSVIKKYTFCLFVYGLVLNTFLAGGLINQFFVFFPVLIALVSSKNEDSKVKSIKIY